MTFKDDMATINKQVKGGEKTGEKVTSVKKAYIQVNHETTRDLINSNLSVFGIPHVEKCIKKDENGNQVFKDGKPVYSYYVKSLWKLKTGEIHTIMISQSTMAYYDANTNNKYSFIINFEDNTDKEIKTLLDGKTICGVTLKYGEKSDTNDSTFIHRKVSFESKMTDLFNQTTKIAEKINDILSGKVTVEELSSPVKGLTILKKEHFPELTTKSKPFVPAKTALVELSSPVASVLSKKEEKKEEKEVKKTKIKSDVNVNVNVNANLELKDSTTPSILTDLIKTFENQRNIIYNLTAEENKLEKDILNSDEEMKEFEIEMKRQLEEGKAKIIKNKSDNITKLETVKANKKAAILENENISKQLIDDISKPSVYLPKTESSWDI